MPSTPANRVLLDAGVFIGALTHHDPRFPEAHPLVEQARRGDLPTCTTAGILSEVYAALTWAGATSRLSPADTAVTVSQLIEPPSAIEVLPDGLEIALRLLQMGASHQLAARRIHDARHAATALCHGVVEVFTYDPVDWADFSADGIQIAGPPSTLARLTRSRS